MNYQYIFLNNVYHRQATIHDAQEIMDLMNESYSIEMEKVKEIIPMSYIIRSEISEELIAVVVVKVRGKITYWAE